MAAVPYSTLHVDSRAAKSPKYRQTLEDHIERMIALLDGLDGDCDLEHADTGGGIDDEPHDAIDEGNEEFSLGWSMHFDQRVAAVQAPAWLDGGWDAA